MRAALVLAIIFCGLAGRTALDKVLAQRGGGELVALWGQVSSVMELVSGPAVSGVAAGVAVLAAQDAAGGRGALREALRLGLAVSGLVALAVGLASFLTAGFAPGIAPLLLLGAAAGWLAVVPGVLHHYWMGMRLRARMLALALATALLPLGAALGVPGEHVVVAIVLAHAAPALVLLAFVPRAGGGEHRAALCAYVLPGLSVGILSPASMLVARAIVAEQISWHEAGVLQALWRITDWVGAIGWGVLTVVFLPRLALASGGPGLSAELGRTLAFVCLPAAAALLGLGVALRPLLALLYDPTFSVSHTAAALFLCGSALRMAAWAALVGLYARRATIAIAAGELLSLPLFALLLAAWPARLTLEAVALAWLIAFAAYAAFNFAALARSR
jgi:hypothetical protein